MRFPSNEYGGPHDRYSKLAHRGRLVRQLQLRRRVPLHVRAAPGQRVRESVLFWHIQRGHYGDVNLDGLSFVRVGRWDGDLWAGKVKGTAGLLIDERADQHQAEALPLIFGGRAGGFPAQVAGLFTEGRQVRGVERARITFEIAPDYAHWGVEIVGKVKAWAKALTGPTSLPGRYPQLMNAPGCETGPGSQLVTWGKSTICSVDAFGYNFRWTTNSSKHIPFDWVGP